MKKWKGPIKFDLSINKSSPLTEQQKVMCVGLQSENEK